MLRISKPPTNLHRDDMPSNISVLLLRIEAGTGRVIELAVTIDLRIGIQLFEHSDQCTKNDLLLGRARVLGMAVFVQTSDVTDTDAVGIVAFAVRACLFDRSTYMYRSIQIHHKMVADADETALAVPLVDVAHRHRPAFRRGGAVHDDLLNPAHRWPLSEFDGSARRTSC